MLRGRLLTVLALGLSTVGCSGTPFGERLSASFSPATGSAPPATGSAAPTTSAPAPVTPAQPGAGSPVKTPSPSASKATAVPPLPAARPVPAAQPLPPAPYRLTLRLPAADPAAPAEAVTQALRAAGVAFEVEMIERAPGLVPPAPTAPSVPSQPAPPVTSQPAPPPR
jgi:hypothetical protein